MPDEQIPFPLTSAPGANAFNSAGRLVNCYAEPLVAGARGQNVWRRAPGISSVKTPSYTGWRGAIVVGNGIYAAFSGSGGKVASYDSSFTEATLGSLAGTKKVFWARNNKAPNPDVVVVDPDNGAFQVTTTPSVITYPDSDVGSPNSVCFQDGYFFFTYGDGTCIASAINDTAIDPLDFVKVDGQDGGLLRAVPFDGELYLCGTNAIEPWQDTANPTGFPYTRVKTIQRGLLGRYAISGYETGFFKGLVFVGDDKRVYALNGYAPQPISTPDVDRAIAGFINAGGSIDNIEMFPYVVGGRSCIVLRLAAGISQDCTWAFDVDSLWWHERHSPDQLTWRAFGSVYFNHQWYAGDAIGQHILQISDAFLGELTNSGETSLPYIIESGPVTAFPNRLRVSQATFNIARGVGMALGSDPQQTDPRCYIQWSDDGGLSWSTPVERKLGKQQTSPAPVRVNRCGMTKDQGRRWRITVYDPVEVELIGGTQSDQVRNY